MIGSNPGYILKSSLHYQTVFRSLDICKEARKRNFLNLIYQAFLKKLWRFYAFLIRPPCCKGRVIMLRHLPEHSATPWARSTKNVKKPQRQMCRPWRKAWFKIFAKQNKKHFWFQSHIWFWGLLLFKMSLNKQTRLRHIMTITSSLRFLYILEGSGLLCATHHHFTGDLYEARQN